MPGKLTEAGAEHLLGLLTPSSLYQLGLFVSDTTPDIGDVADASDYTEASFDGYSRVVLSDWDPIESDPGEAWCEHAQADFMPSGSASGTVYGVLLFHYSSGDLVMAIRYATPKTVTPGINIPARVKLRLKDPTVS